MRGIAPAIRQMPKITEMIGYLSFELDTSTLGSRITLYRYMQGITPKEFGFLVLADASTIFDWEKGKHIPSQTRRLRLEEIFKYGSSSKA
jgi:DNA-binding transcriptional regulator YiaG